MQEWSIPEVMDGHDASLAERNLPEGLDMEEYMVAGSVVLPQIAKPTCPPRRQSFQFNWVRSRMATDNTWSNSNCYQNSSPSAASTLVRCFHLLNIQIRFLAVSLSMGIISWPVKILEAGKNKKHMKPRCNETKERTSTTLDVFNFPGVISPLCH